MLQQQKVKNHYYQYHLLVLVHPAVLEYPGYLGVLEVRYLQCRPFHLFHPAVLEYPGHLAGLLDQSNQYLPSGLEVQYLRCHPYLPYHLSMMLFVQELNLQKSWFHLHPLVQFHLVVPADPALPVPPADQLTLRAVLE